MNYGDNIRFKTDIVNYLARIIDKTVFNGIICHLTWINLGHKPL